MTAALVEVTRRDVRTGAEIVESFHGGHLVMTGPDDEVVGALGDPVHRTLVRSAAKPFQAGACLELLDPAGAALTPAEVAVAWSSHRAEPRQLDAVGRLLERSATPREHLTCPVAVGQADPSGVPSRLRSDCSGKHALFALAGQRMGLSREALLDAQGPLQRVVLRVLDEAIGPVEALVVDGCGAPAVGVPLVGLARGFAALATGGRWAPVRDAGLAHPELVGGEGRADSALLHAGLVAKSGAEGVFAAGWTDHRGARYGLAVKVADGASRGAATAAVSLLEGSGQLPDGTWRAPAPTGGGRPVGEIRPSLELRGLTQRLADGSD